MNPLIRSSCCLAAIAALANCGGGASKNDSGNIATTSQTVATGSTNTLAPAAPPATAVAANEKRITIEALPIAQPGPGTAVGAFHMIRSASGIETDGIGGGCMVFEDPASAVCHQDSDCRVPKYISAANGPWAYCAEQKCWIKPADKAFCWKSRYSTPQLFKGPAKNQTKVRVIACLNGKFKPGDAPPCAGGSGPHVEDIGDAKTLTK